MRAWISTDPYEFTVIPADGNAVFLEEEIVDIPDSLWDDYKAARQHLAVIKRAILDIKENDNEL